MCGQIGLITINVDCSPDPTHLLFQYKATAISPTTNDDEKVRHILQKAQRKSSTVELGSLIYHQALSQLISSSDQITKGKSRQENLFPIFPFYVIFLMNKSNSIKRYKMFQPRMKSILSRQAG